MESVEFRGDHQDLDRFARHVLKHSVSLDASNPFERRMRWDAPGSAGFSSSTSLRSGLRLSATKLAWDRPMAFQFRAAAAPLKFMLGRGLGPRIRLADGSSSVMGESMLQVSHSTRATSTTCEFVQGGAEFAQLALEVEPRRLRELLGAQRLPEALERLLGSTTPQAFHEQFMTPNLRRLLDEILAADARESSRQLFLEAKGLELLAVMIDELELASQALSPLGQRDIERLEGARCVLLSRMDAPPSLAELSRLVGLNEFKLKAGFRSLFGDSVFGYLRVQRMEAARRLLVQRHLSVTEVAAQVGYANASKFAAAFRKHFGFAPSTLR